MRKPARVSVVVTLVLLCGYSGGCAAAPPGVLRDLEKADEFVLYSLDPRRQAEEPKDGFHGWLVLGRTQITDAGARKKLVAALEQGVREHDGSIAHCFNPRHGIRATRAGKSVDLVICFECFQVEVFTAGQPDKGFLVSASPQQVFDEALRQADIPLPGPAK